MIKKIFRKLFFDKTFLKFIIVGIVNSLFGYLIGFLFLNVIFDGSREWQVWVSSAANYFFGSILSYFLNKYFTFQNKTRSFAVVARFVINIVVCYFLAYIIAIPLTRWILSGLDDKLQNNIAMIVGMGFFMILNYIGQRFFAFKKSDDEIENSNSSEKSNEEGKE